MLSSFLRSLLPSHLSFIFFFFNVSTNRACQVAQMINNLPAMEETQVRSLGWEDPLEKGMATQTTNTCEARPRGGIGSCP